MAKEEELQFPIEFDKCPVCGSTRRLVALVTDEEIEKGNIKKETKGKIPFLSGRAAIFDPTALKLISIPSHCPVLVGYFDICLECGTLYCTKIEKHIGHVQVERKPGIPPFGKG